MPLPRLAVCLLAAAVVGGCASNEPKPLPPPEPVSVDDARRKVAAAARQDGPAGDAFASYPIQETTPPRLFDELGVQTFRVTGGPAEYETFAVTDEQVLRLGSGFGGPGITAFSFEDADGDGAGDLLWAVGSGTGIKQYGVGLVDRPGFRPYDANDPPFEADPTPRPLRERKVALRYRDAVELRRNDAGQMEVWDSGRKVRLGRLRVIGDMATFEAESDLPPEVRRRFLEPRM
jgi:hypothetical protein